VATLAWVCAGGALGSGARFLLAGWLTARAGAPFPAGTLAVNLLGSFLLALLLQVPTATLSTATRTALASGVLGGFTTYSAFSFETFAQLETGAPGVALGYVAATLLGCLAACWLGTACGRLAFAA
jgi:fluoride exporter